MAHKHSIYDSDAHFEINPATRAIKNVSATKTAVIQHDHNSERFTFKLPRMIEGHDMTACNVVEIHYLNIDATTKVQNKGVYTVNDLQISPDDEDMVICSWLISNNATQLVGSLHFLVRFACVSNDSVIEYAWNTAIFTAISVSSGIYNSDAIAEQYADILNAWKAELDFAKMTSVEQTEESTADGGVNIWTATFGSGEKSELRVRNGSQGVPGKSAFETAAEAGYEGSEAEFADRILGTPFAIKTVNGEILNFFIGTQAQFDALETKEPNTIYYITDDDTLDAINADIDFKVQALLAKLQAGEIVVKKAAEAETATNATNATKATNADKATLADRATNADKATNATNAEKIIPGDSEHRNPITPKSIGAWKTKVGSQTSGRIDVNGVASLPSNVVWECLFMDNYGAADINKAVVFGIAKNGTLNAFIARGTRNSTSETEDTTLWAEFAEFITSKNIAEQTVKKATDADNATLATQVAMTKSSGNNNKYVLVTQQTSNTSKVTPEHSGSFMYNPYTDTVTAGTFKGNFTGNVTGNASTATLATRTQYTINLKIKNNGNTLANGVIIYWSNGVKQTKTFNIASGVTPNPYVLSNVDAGSLICIGNDLYAFEKLDVPGIQRTADALNSVITTELNDYAGGKICFTASGSGYAFVQISSGK